MLTLRPLQLKPAPASRLQVGVTDVQASYSGCMSVARDGIDHQCAVAGAVAGLSAGGAAHEGFERQRRKPKVGIGNAGAVRCQQTTLLGVRALTGGGL